MEVAIPTMRLITRAVKVIAVFLANRPVFLVSSVVPKYPPNKPRRELSYKDLYNSISFCATTRES